MSDRKTFGDLFDRAMGRQTWSRILDFLLHFDSPFGSLRTVVVQAPVLRLNLARSDFRPSSDRPSPTGATSLPMRSNWTTIHFSVCFPVASGSNIS